MLVVREYNAFIVLRFRNLQNGSMTQERNSKESMFLVKVQFRTS